MSIHSFVRELLDAWDYNSCCDIDGADFQDLLLKHGLFTMRPATEEDCKTDQAKEWEYEIGDPILIPSTFIRELLSDKGGSNVG